MVTIANSIYISILPELESTEVNAFSVRAARPLHDKPLGTQQSWCPRLRIMDADPNHEFNAALSLRKAVKDCAVNPDNEHGQGT